MWAFKPLCDKGLVYEGYRVLPYCWRDETPLSNHELRMDDDVYQTRQDPARHRRLPAADDRRRLTASLPGLDDDAVDAAVQPGARGRPRHRLRRGRSDRTDGRAATSLAAAPAGRATPRELGEDAASVVAARCTGARAGRAARTRRCSPYFDAGTPNAFQVLAADFVTTEDGTGIVHLAPAFGEDDQAVADAAGIAPVVPVDDGRPVHLAGARLRGPAGLRREPADHPRPEAHGRAARRGAAAPRDLRALLPALLALPQPADLQGGVVLVRRGHRRSGTAWSSCNQEITWVPEHVKDGQFGKWLASARDWSITRNRFWGTPDPGVEVATTRPTRGSTSTARSTSWSATSASRADRPAPPVHRRADPAQPGRPDRAVDDAPGRRTCSTAGSTPARCRSPRCTTRSRTASGSSTTTRATSSSSTSARPAAGSTRCTCSPPRCSTGRRSATCVATASCSATTARRCRKSLRNYPDVTEVFDRDGSDAMRWFLMSSPILRGGNLIVTEQGIRDGVRQVLLPLWNAWYFFTLYANAAEAGTDRRDVAHRLDRRARPLHPGQDRPSSSTTVPTALDALRHRGRLRRGPRASSTC